MRRKPYPLNVIARANTILQAWELISTSVAIGPINHRGLTNDIAQIQNLEKDILEAQLKLNSLREQRDAAYVSLWVKVKGLYDSVKSLYGDDSIEYELVGRTRSSKRRRPARQ